MTIGKSILLDIPYFDPVKMGAIDSMHNFWLGVGKITITNWIKKQKLVDKGIAAVIVPSLSLPVEISRKPRLLKKCKRWKGIILF